MTDIGLTCAAKLFCAYNVCPACVERILGDISPVSTTGQTCPLCIGLLHHPECVGDLGNRTLYAIIVDRICQSGIEFSACHLRIRNTVIAVKKSSEIEYWILLDCRTSRNESNLFLSLVLSDKIVPPPSLLVREYIFWSLLYRLALRSDSPEYRRQECCCDWKSLSVIDQPTGCFNTSQLDAWKLGYDRAHVVWKRLADSSLTSRLKVPLLESLDTSVNQSAIHPHSTTLLVDLTLDASPPDSLPESLAVFLRNPTNQLAGWPASTTFHRDGCHPHRRLANSLVATLLHHLPHSPDASPLLDNLLQDALSTDECPIRPTSIDLTRPVSCVLAGRYVKLDRLLPQTPWLVDSTRRLDSSVEEEIKNPLLDELKAQPNQLVFSSSGREDVDVRCLGSGRPFIIRVNQYGVLLPNFVKRWADQSGSTDNGSSNVSLLKLAQYINARTRGRVFVRDLQIVDPLLAGKAIKSGEMAKTKFYRAVCRCPSGGLTSELVQRLAQACKLPAPSHSLVWPPPVNHTTPYTTIQLGSLALEQQTPLRVLHRRPLLNRKRLIHDLRLADFSSVVNCNLPEVEDFKRWSTLYPSSELFILEMCCEAGTYVKEFVHGDLGRTKPSLASLMDRQIDLFALDVIAVEVDWPPRLSDPIVCE